MINAALCDNAQLLPGALKKVIDSANVHYTISIVCGWIKGTISAVFVIYTVFFDNGIVL